MLEGTSWVSTSASQEERRSSFVRLAEHLMAHRAWCTRKINACLVGENPTLSIPAAVGMRGCMAIMTTYGGAHARGIHPTNYLQHRLPFEAKVIVPLIFLLTTTHVLQHRFPSNAEINPGPFFPMLQPVRFVQLLGWGPGALLDHSETLANSTNATILATIKTKNAVPNTTDWATSDSGFINLSAHSIPAYAISAGNTA